jgi:hypothetical protein
MLFSSFTKQVTLLRRSTVQSLPAQLVLPVLRFKIVRGQIWTEKKKNTFSSPKTHCRECLRLGESGMCAREYERVRERKRESERVWERDRNFWGKPEVCGLRVTWNEHLSEDDFRPIRRRQGGSTAFGRKTFRRKNIWLKLLTKDCLSCNCQSMTWPNVSWTSVFWMKDVVPDYKNRCLFGDFCRKNGHN